MEDTVLYNIEPPIATITINRPNYLNALNADVLKGIIEAVDIVERSKKVHAIIVTGAGDKSFVAGADIASMAELGDGGIREYIELGQRAMFSLEQCSVPVIAAVNGYALGGGLELALACDLIIASSKAQCGQPEVNLGIIPGFGGTPRLMKRAGVGVARRLIYSGDIIKSDVALQYGIFDEVVEPEKLIEHAKELAKRIASKGPLAVKSAKKVMRDIFEPELSIGLKKEVDAFVELFKTSDRAEGMKAFLQKRPPNFTGQ